MEKDETSTSSMFCILKEDKLPKPETFAKAKIMTGIKSLSSLPAQEKNSVLSHLGDIDEVQSSIPSRMKCTSTLDVKIDGLNLK